MPKSSRFPFSVLVAKNAGDGLFRHLDTYSCKANGRIGLASASYASAEEHFAHIAANAMAKDPAILSVDYMVGTVVFRVSKVVDK